MQTYRNTFKNLSGTPKRLNPKRVNPTFDVQTTKRRRACPAGPGPGAGLEPAHGAGAGPGGASPPPFGMLYILASFLDVLLKSKTVNPKRVNPKFGFTFLDLPFYPFRVYANISKIYKDIPRHTKYPAVAGPPRPVRPGGTGRTGTSAGPGGAAAPPLGILYILLHFCISWIYLDLPFWGPRRIYFRHLLVSKLSSK